MGTITMKNARLPARQGKLTVDKIYILHGWTYSVERWEPFVKLLKKSGFDVTLLKIPGLTDVIDRPWVLEDYVEWLDNALPKNQKVILIGHSNGGRISGKFTAQNPDRVEKLFLIDSAGIYDNDLYIKFKRSVFGTAAKIGKHVFNFPAARKLLYKATRESDYEKASPIMRSTMKNLIRIDLSSDFVKITVPTVIIWGKNDTATPLRHGDKIHELIPHSKFYVIDSARHSPMFTNSEEVVDIIVREVLEESKETQRLRSG